MLKEKIGIIGLGNMGRALALGLKQADLIPSQNIMLFDINENRLDAVAKEIGASRVVNNQELVTKSQGIILAIKPQDVAKVLEETNDSWTTDKFIISIAAGITTSYLEAGIKEKLSVIRAMPNIPGQIGAGITAISSGCFTNSQHMEIARTVFRIFGEVIEVKEEELDLVTALSGSGPAYFFLVMEVLIEAGRDLGLEKPAAEKLVKETALGAAKLAKISSRSLAQLREEVTSPGGTTEAALKVFEKVNIRKIIFQAVEAAKQKSALLNQT